MKYLRRFILGYEVTGLVWQFNMHAEHWWWHNKIYDTDYECWSHFAGIGPFQFHWYGRYRW